MAYNVQLVLYRYKSTAGHKKRVSNVQLILYSFKTASLKGAAVSTQLVIYSCLQCTADSVQLQVHTADL